MASELNREIHAIHECHRALTRKRLVGRPGSLWFARLDSEEQARALFWLASKLGVIKQLRNLIEGIR